MKGLLARLFGLGGSEDPQPVAPAGTETFLGYELSKKVAMAGPVTTYLGRDPKTDQPVSIRLLDLSKRGDKDRGPRFLREIEIYRRLVHPNLVTFLAGGEEDGRPGMVLEWLQAPTLQAVFRDDPRSFQPAEALALFRQLLGALAAAHSQDVVHRAVSPKNIHIVDGATLKLVNFSEAKAADPKLSTRVGTHFGDFRYSSPEQNKAQATDRTTDLYSAGLILYELLSGRRALTGEGLVDVLGQQLREEFIPPSRHRIGVPDELDGLFKRLLAFDAARRPSSAAAVLAKLDALGLD